MDIIKKVAKHTNTNASEWEFSEGPETGVGVEHWLVNDKIDMTVYVCVDQGEITSIQVQSDEDEDIDPDDGLEFEDDEV